VKARTAFGPEVPGHSATVTYLSFTADGRLVTASQDNTIRVWDPTTAKELMHHQADEVPWQMAVSPDGSLMAGARFSPIGVWVRDLKTGKEVFKFVWSTSRTGGVYGMRFSADEQTLLTYGSDWHLRAWDTLTGKLKVERRFRPDAVLGPEDDEDETEKQILRFDPRALDLGPDGNTLVMGLGKDVAAYALDTGKERFKLEADPQRVQTVVLSNDGQRLATVGFGPPPPKNAVPEIQKSYPVTVWDMTEAKQLSRFQVPGWNFYGVLAFTPDGKRVVTGSGDDVLRFWDVATGAPVGVIDLPRPASRVAFDGGQRMAVGFQDPTILIYDLHAALKPPMKE
jgi:WD40 repeat protein